MGAIPAEGLLGRIVADALIHYFNVVGAYLICVAMIAVALYLSTAFSFGAVQIWSQTRFSFAYAALDRFADWRAERERKKAAKELEKKRATANAKPVVTAQLVPRRAETSAEKPGPRTPTQVPAPSQFGALGWSRAELSGCSMPNLATPSILRQHSLSRNWPRQTQ